MRCPGCGLEIKEGERLCPVCGTALGDLNEEERAALSVNPARRALVKIAVVVFVWIGLTIGLICYERYTKTSVYLVKHSSPALFPAQTWGRTLEENCSGGEWKEKRSGGEKIVVFTGKLKSSGERLEVVFRIKSKDSFVVESATVGGEKAERIRTFINSLFSGEYKKTAAAK